MALKLDPITGELVELQDVEGTPAPQTPQQAETSPINPQVADYLKQKYNMGEFSNENRQKLVADQEVGTGDRVSAMLAAAGAGFLGQDPFAAGQGVLKSAKADKRQKIDDFDKARANLLQERDIERKSVLQGREDEGYEREKNIRAEMEDPSSEMSRVYQQAAAARGIPLEQVSGLSGRILKERLPFLEKEVDNRLREQQMKEQAALRREMQKDRAQARLDNLEDRHLRREELRGQQLKEEKNKKEEIIEKDVQKLSDKIGNAQELSNALKSVDAQLGFSIDEAQIVDGKVVAKGKKRDLPGVSLPGLGRISFYDGDARNLQTAIARVFNTELKDRSGAAVTTPELERLKTEFGSGRFNTESEMVQALKDYKTIVAQEIKNREAAFRPEVVERYKERGGSTSEVFKQAQSEGQYPKKVRRGDQVATVSTPEEEAEAREEGFE